MKGNFKFIIFIILLLIIMFTVEQSAPKKFVWTPTYSKNDRQPFGCFVFDNVVSTSLKYPYSVSKETLYQMAEDSLSRPKAILIVADYIFMDKLAIKSMFTLLRRGNKMMFVGSTFSPFLIDTLKIDAHNSYFEEANFKSMMGQPQIRERLLLSDPAFSKRAFRFYPQLCSDYFSGVDSLEPKPANLQDKKPRKHSWLDSVPTTVLARNKYKFPVAFSKKIGKGELFLVSTPLLFTNYGMLDQGNARYLFSLLSYLKGMPLVRSELYGSKSVEEISPLRYFLSQPPLRGSIYLILFCIILFMCFAAKRKQRIIPVVNPPVNATLDFVKLIGTLYYQKKGHLGLLRKKQIYFTQTLKRETNIDIEEEELTMDLCQRISNKTGMEAEKIYLLLKDLERLKADVPIDEVTLKEYIDRMNEIINNSYN